MAPNERVKKFIDSLPAEEQILVPMGLMHFVLCKERNMSPDDAISSLLTMYAGILGSREEAVRVFMDTMEAVKLIVEDECKEGEGMTIYGKELQA